MLRDIVAETPMGAARRRRVIPVVIGSPRSQNWELRVHEFVLPRPVTYAWIDPSSDAGEPQVVVVKSSPRIRSAKAAVDASIARECEEVEAAHVHL